MAASTSNTVSSYQQFMKDFEQVEKSLNQSEELLDEIIAFAIRLTNINKNKTNFSRDELKAYEQQGLKDVWAFGDSGCSLIRSNPEINREQKENIINLLRKRSSRMPELEMKKKLAHEIIQKYLSK